MYNAYLPIQHMDRPSKISPGGLCEFFYAKKEDVFSWPLQNPATSTYTEEVILKEGKTWYRCQVIDPDRDYTEESKVGEAGPFVEMRLRGFLPDDSPINTLTAGTMPLHEYVVVLRERNGIQRLLGSEDAGAKFAQTYESADADGTRGRSLVFTWRSQFNAGIYLSVVTAGDDVVNPPWPGGSGPESDPTVPQWVKSITENQVLNWDLAFSWGAHTSAGYLTKLMADVFYSPLGHTHSLEGLSNVVIESLLGNQLLRYDVGLARWVNWTPTFAPGVHTHNFSELLNKPTTLVGYGITDAYLPPPDDTSYVISADKVGLNEYPIPTLNRRFRVFKDGLLLSRRFWDPINPDGTGGFKLIIPGDVFEEGQEFTIVQY